MNGELTDWATAVKTIREAHRYCTVPEHGGHAFEDCPMWLAFLLRTIGKTPQRRT